MFSFSSNNPIIKRNYLQEPLQNENREKTIYRDVPSNLIVITFPMCERKNKDYYVYDLISDILSNGKSSRLYNNLVVEKKKFTAIDAVVSGDDDKGMFMILGKYADDTDIKEGEKLIWQELENLINNPSSEKEFMKVKNKNISTTTFNNIKILDKAMNLAYYYHLDMLENINKDKDNYKQVTINDITTLAKRTFFEGKHNTLYYLAQK
jgi:predicted Zn-dependent peptidase